VCVCVCVRERVCMCGKAYLIQLKCSILVRLSIRNSVRACMAQNLITRY